MFGLALGGALGTVPFAFGFTRQTNALEVEPFDGLKRKNTSSLTFMR